MGVIRPVTAHIQIKDTRMLTHQGKLGLRIGPDVPVSTDRTMPGI
jgi:hypothetical protein